MPSIIIPARNDEFSTAICIETTLHSLSRLNWIAEIILIDDASEPDENIISVFARARAGSPKHRFKIVRSTHRQHYSGVFSIGLHLSTQDPMFFISNDMMVTPSFLELLQLVSIVSPEFGIVRGTSNFTDSHPEHRVEPSPPPADYDEVEFFSRDWASRIGTSYVEDSVLSGDAVLVKRSVVERIGVLDLRFFGYFGDVDYGMRAQLAGFKLVCAKGAWLLHKGAGHVRRELERIQGSEFEPFQQQRMALVASAYQQFRQKWNISMPDTYSGQLLDFAGIARANAGRVELKYELPRSVLDQLETY